MNARRVQLGLTWTQVAERAGIHRDTLTEFRAGRGKANPLTVRAIETALRWAGNSINDIDNDGEPTPLEVVANQPATTATPQGDDADDVAQQPILGPAGVPYRDFRGNPVTPARIADALDYTLAAKGIDSWRRMLTEMAQQYGLPVDDS